MTKQIKFEGSELAVLRVMWAAPDHCMSFNSLIGAFCGDNGLTIEYLANTVRSMKAKGILKTALYRNGNYVALTSAEVDALLRV